MSDTATETQQPEHEQYDTEVFAPGEACGVCHFPVGEGQICGNTVYANVTKGRLPLYCGQDGQAGWQQQNGTEGNARHRSELATYPRKKFGMAKEDPARLAAEEAARRGIGRRKLRDDAPADSTASEEAPAEPVSQVDALAELAQLFIRGVGAVRQEVEAAHEESAARVAEVAAEREQWAAEVEQEKAALAEEKEALAADRAAAAADTERAVIEVQDANDARLTVEGELKAARGRIAELEQEIKAMREQHHRDLTEVRQREEARFDRMVAAFAATRPATELETAAPEPRKAPTTPGPDAQEKMMSRVENGHVTVVNREWVLSNAKANTAAANTLSWLLKECRITVTNEGQVKPVTLATVRENVEQLRQQK